MDYLKTIVFYVLVVAGIVGLNTWFDARDEKLFEAMATYQKCVMLEYRMSPSYYNHTYGHYPECNSF